MLHRILALTLVLAATAAMAQDAAPPAAAPVCQAIASDQVPTPARAALIAAGVDAAKISSCTIDGVVRYCGKVVKADGTKSMIEVDATGAALAPSAAAGGCCAAGNAAAAAEPACCAPAPAAPAAPAVK